MDIGVPKETHPGERRVAASPEVVSHLIKLGFNLSIEREAGLSASFSDSAYQRVGAKIEPDTRTLWAASDIILKVRAPSNHPLLEIHEATLLQPGTTLVSFVWPDQNPELLEQMAAGGTNMLAMDAVPRISRAQKLDALSSMANVAGYRAVVEAASHFGRFFTGQVTAAGKVPPAKIMIIGAGVAGLAAIGTASNMGAIVRAFDTRPEVKEQVESMGAEFLMLDFEEQGSGAGGYAKVMSESFIAAEMALFTKQAQEVDIIITTALIPGKPAPNLITADMVRSMKDGSVIVDLAAEQGGNCDLTQPGDVVLIDGVTVIGYTDLPSRMPAQSSQLYGTNIRYLLEDLCPGKDGQIQIDMKDEVLRSMTVVKSGEVTWPPPEIKRPVVQTNPELTVKPKTAQTRTSADGNKNGLIGMGIVIALIIAVGSIAPASFMNHFTVFILSIFVGWQVIWNVTPALHTPLMSVTNAISGIIVIGALLKINAAPQLVVILAAVSLLIASINICGGFLVTQKMLSMFRRDL